MSYTEQLERDTERTRLELADTIEELRYRLTPGEVLDEVLDYASDGDVGDYLRSFKRQIIENPIPLGLMGASIAWLIAASAFGRRGDGRMMRDRVARNAGDIAATARARAGDFAEATRERAGELAEATRAQAGDLVEGAQGTAADLAESARATGADIADSARMAAHDLGDRAAEMRADATNRAVEAAQDARAAAARMGDRMRDAASTAGANLAAAGDSIADHASRSAEALGGVASDIGRNSRAASRAVYDFAHEQPLIVAAAGLVLGAIIGALLPSTETEDRLIGESSEAAKEKLREMAGEQYAKAKDIAARTAEAALDGTAASEPSAHDAAEPHEPAGFGPGPGGHASVESGDHPTRAEEAEHTHARGA